MGSSTVKRVQVYVPGSSHWSRDLVCTKAFTNERGELILITEQGHTVVYAAGAWASFVKENV